MALTVVRGTDGGDGWSISNGASPFRLDDCFQLLESWGAGNIETTWSAYARLKAVYPGTIRRYCSIIWLKIATLLRKTAHAIWLVSIEVQVVDLRESR